MKGPTKTAEVETVVNGYILELSKWDGGDYVEREREVHTDMSSVVGRITIFYLGEPK